LIGRVAEQFAGPERRRVARRAFLAEQRKQPGQPILPTLRLMSGGGAPKPPELHYEVQREIE